jgi:ankyrin repeat protein
LKRLFIETNDGNPKKLNKQKQNVLHTICEGINDLKQLDCLNIVLEWRDKSTNEKIDVNDKDIYDNTPLHYAAVKNLKECVQVTIKFLIIVFFLFLLIPFS